MSQQQYASGGYIGVDHTPVGWALIHPDECIIAKRGDAFVCIRDHEHAEIKPPRQQRLKSEQ